MVSAVKTDPDMPPLARIQACQQNNLSALAVWQCAVRNQAWDSEMTGDSFGFCLNACKNILDLMI